MKNLISSILIVWGVVGCLSSQAEIKSYQLDNGLKLIVKEDHRSKAVVSQIWYKVGSVDEPAGVTGTSHLLEHMMFQGTTTTPNSLFDKRIKEIGGMYNAATTRDFTYFYEKVPAQYLETCFELESDRMQHLALSEKEFLREKNVVMEERRLRVDDDPQSALMELFTYSIYGSSGYHNPVIGWMNDIRRISQPILKNWYLNWYAPNNAVLVVVGDVNADAVFSLAKKYFAQIPARKIVPSVEEKASSSLGSHTLKITREVKLPWLLMGYRTPSLLQHPGGETYALDVLRVLLCEGESARLKKALLREKELAQDIWVDYDSFSRLNSALMIGATPSLGVSLQQLQQAILKEIEALQKTPVGEKELTRAKTILQSEKIFAKDSIEYQATELGQWEVNGLSWQLDDTYLDSIQKVTAEDIQAVAKKYLDVKGVTVGYLIPGHTK